MRSPLLPCSIISGMPATAVATTGVPSAMASRTTCGMPSRRLVTSTTRRGLDRGGDVVHVPGEQDRPVGEAMTSASRRRSASSFPEPTTRSRASGSRLRTSAERRERVPVPLVAREPPEDRDDRRAFGDAEGRPERAAAAPRESRRVDPVRDDRDPRRRHETGQVAGERAAVDDHPRHARPVHGAIERRVAHRQGEPPPLDDSADARELRRGARDAHGPFDAGAGEIDPPAPHPAGEPAPGRDVEVAGHGKLEHRVPGGPRAAGERALRALAATDTSCPRARSPSAASSTHRSPPPSARIELTNTSLTRPPPPPRGPPRAPARRPRTRERRRPASCPRRPCACPRRVHQQRRERRGERRRVAGRHEKPGRAVLSRARARRRRTSRRPAGPAAMYSLTALEFSSLPTDDETQTSASASRDGTSSRLSRDHDGGLDPETSRLVHEGRGLPRPGLADEHENGPGAARHDGRHRAHEDIVPLDGREAGDVHDHPRAVGDAEGAPERRVGRRRTEDGRVHGRKEPVHAFRWNAQPLDDRPA